MCDMPNGHMLPLTHKICDMPSGHVALNPKTYNMPSSCMVSPRTSGCTTSTCTIPLALTFPVPLPLHSIPHSLSGTMLNCRNLRTYPDPAGYPSNINSQHHIYIRHTFPLAEKEHTQDSYTFIMDLEDPPDYHSPILYNIHKTTPKDNPGAFCMEGRHIMQDSIMQDNLAALLSHGGHTYNRYPNRSDLLEEGHTQTDLNPYDSFINDSFA